MTNEEMKRWIDNATYKQLLFKWRFAPIGSLWFQGDIGKYYDKAMSKQRNTISNEEHVSTSKEIGWS